MAVVTIITKNSSIPGLAPSAGNLVQGELAVNVADKKLYTLDSSGNVVLVAGSSAFTTPITITANSNPNSALTVTQAGNGGGVRITNTGSGNSLLVEDSANPDSTPFVVDAAGRVGIGLASPTVALDVVGDSGGGVRITNTGSGNSLLVEDSASPDSTPFVIDAAGRVGVGLTTPTVALDVVGELEVQAAATQDAIKLQGRAGGTSSYAVTFTPTTLSANRTITLPDANIDFTTGLGVAQGGTGQTSFTNGQLLIGNTTGNTLTKSTLTAGSGITITNGAGSITIEATGGGGGISTGKSIAMAMIFGF